MNVAPPLRDGSPFLTALGSSRARLTVAEEAAAVSVLATAASVAALNPRLTRSGLLDAQVIRNTPQLPCLLFGLWALLDVRVQACCC